MKMKLMALTFIILLSISYAGNSLAMNQENGVDQPLKIAIVGDTGMGTGGFRPGFEKIIEKIITLKPDILIHIGDYVYTGRNVKQCDAIENKFINEIKNKIGKEIKFVLVVGDNDIEKAKCWEKIVELNDDDQFKLLPKNVSGSGSYEGIRKFKNVVIAVRNSNIESKIKKKKERKIKKIKDKKKNKYLTKYDIKKIKEIENRAKKKVNKEIKKFTKWIGNEFSSHNNNDPWKIIVQHEPPLSVSYSKPNKAILGSINKLAPDLVFAGHHHSYQRFFPTPYPIFKTPKNNDDSKCDPSYSKPTKTVDESKGEIPTFDRQDGAIHIVTGGGGAQLRPIRQKGEWDCKAQYKESLAKKGIMNHFITLEIDDTKNEITGKVHAVCPSETNNIKEKEKTSKSQILIKKIKDAKKSWDKQDEKTRKKKREEGEKYFLENYIDPSNDWDDMSLECIEPQDSTNDNKSSYVFETFKIKKK